MPHLDRIDSGQSMSIHRIGYYTRSFKIIPTANKKSFFLIFCESGTGLYRHNGKFRTINRGQYIIIKESDSFFMDHKTEQIKIFVFNFSYYVTYTITTHGPEITLTDINSTNHRGKNIFMVIYEILSSADSERNIPYATALLMGFIETERFLGKNFIITNPRDCELLDKAIQYMHDNMQKKITIDNLQAHLECSRNKLFSLFKDHKATTPLKLLNEIRIKRACFLLKTPILHINEICKMVGICNQTYFSRLFTKTIGMSPTEYRKNIWHF